MKGFEFLRLLQWKYTLIEPGQRIYCKSITPIFILIYKIQLEKYIPPLPNYQQYRQRYNSTCQLWRSEPVKDRKLNNPVCVAVLILMTALFLGIGGYFIATKSDYQQEVTPYTTDTTFDISKQIAPIVVCTILSMVVGLLYIFLIKLAPKGMIMVMIFSSLGLIGVLCVIGLIIQNYALAITMGVMLLIYTCVLVCFRKRIRTGIVLVKVATNFISQKPIIFLTPIIKLILTILFAGFWAYTLSLMIQKGDYQESHKQDSTGARALTGVWMLFWLFYNFFFYYMMVFTVAVTCAFWYYNVNDRNPIKAAYQWMFKSALGAITFAALLISIVTFARLIIDSKRKQAKNLAVAVCLCIMSCLLRQIQALLKILNHNTIICMAVTGQDFIDSAKTAIGIVCNDMPLFSVTRLISNLLVFWGIIISVGIPCVVAYLWVGLKENTKHDAGWVIVIVAFGSIMISGMIYSILVESVSSVFIFYCFDRRFRELGYPCHNMPQEINRELGNAEAEANGSYGKLNQTN